uniref:Laminin subunit beta 3 n=1 Tax=Paramormyrops kingsleyae TaxID=1676925 RepID=A0A3B3RIX6_9TELE|nr:laminin subunit beta-3 isoform X1 [Paramormyrops kingsleyae]XP_023696883.1 laminin subunit beta-3 isoform X1 [Paramormyrops kingsleyae]
MKIWILLPMAALAALCGAQRDCQRGACYPPSGDLLLGRDTYLRASSTCGLAAPETFCTLLGLGKVKCCPCDSRNPSGQNAHTIQNVLSTAGPSRWWQSEKGVSPVTLQLDLPHLLQLDTLVMDFKGPRPNALVVERSTDSGKTWQPALYMAEDCSSAFPATRTTLPRSLQETYCYALPPFPTNPYLDQTIRFSPLKQFSEISSPLSHKVEEASGFTNLRVNLTQLGPITRTTGRSASLFYALKELRVIGTCFCHGHANRCLPDTSSNQLPSVEVSQVCDCQHNTAGVSCERCADLYNDLPWRAAEDGQTHTCKRCECNNHAHRCRFDQALFEASGRRSGGVCEGCLHNTAGPHCDRCAPGYYRNPGSAIDRPDACLRCQCSDPGTKAGGMCDPETGACHCKANVEGPRCDRCRAGHYGLSADNPLGCRKCSCGSQADSPCDPVTGQCRCPPSVQGPGCDRCAPNHWNLLSPRGCEPCNCDPNNSYGQTCDQLTGQCQCRPGFGGRTCTECPDNTYGYLRSGCQPCKCEQSGTARCDKRTGACICLQGVTGSRCNTCARGHCSRFPACPVCPSCFFTLDQELRNLTQTLERLSTRGSSLPSIAVPDLSLRIQALEASLSQIQSSLQLPLESARRTTEVLGELRRLRNLANSLDPGAFPTDKGLTLAYELEDLSASLQSLMLEYNRRRDSLNGGSTSSYRGPFSAIQSAYQDSKEAMRKAEASQELLKQAAQARGDTLSLVDRVQLTNTRNLEELERDLTLGPNLTPIAKMVCGSTRSTPCTPQQCDGLLCPTTASCGQEEDCIGALPLGNKAVASAEEVKAKLKNFNTRITQVADQIQKTQDSANQVRLTTDDLATQIKQTRNTLEADLSSARLFVKKLKDLLRDPNSDPAIIQTVSEGVLNTKLPLSLDSLKRKLEEIQRLAVSLPDSSSILTSTGPQLDKARRLLMEAETARDDALEVGGKVNSFLSNLSSTEGLMDNLEAKIQGSLGQLDQANKNIAKANVELGPALETVRGVEGIVRSMQPQLDSLRTLVQSGTQLANKAQDQAQGAQQEAMAAATGIQTLEDQLKLLQQKAMEAGWGGTDGVSEESVRRLQEEASALIQETSGMMKTLAARETSLQEATDQLLQKASMLNGLDIQVQDILANIRKRAYALSHCQL